MKYVKHGLLAVLVGVGVALTYFFFERAVHHAINYIWEDLFDTNTNRLMVLPICLGLSIIYFGTQHFLDPKAEKAEQHGLGSMPQLTVHTYIKVLAIGFLSLVAGASLGPEAILVPACIVLGGYVGKTFLGDKKSKIIEFGILGFVALFVAFFNSFVIGMLSLLLVKKQFKVQLHINLVALSLIAAASAAITLRLLSDVSYFNLPPMSWHINIATIMMVSLVGLAGYLGTYILKFGHDFAKKISDGLSGDEWWLHASVAAAGLIALYLLGGNLVQFTGNESIAPMFHQAPELGIIGLIWIFIIKIAAMSWSKAFGYRGGLIFPTVFAASILAAIASQMVSDVNVVYVFIAAMIGFFIADSKAHILL